MSKDISFWKIEATGNDFVLIDQRESYFESGYSELSKMLCNRRMGIGADGAIFIQDARGYDFEMLYFNCDGSGPIMCGNGGRASVFFVYKSGICRKNCYCFLSADAEHLGRVDGERVFITVERVGKVKNIKLDSGEGYLVNTGAPHLVLVRNEIMNIDMKREASHLRKLFDVNVNYVERVDTGVWKIRTYERGVEDETLACGTGSVASAILVSEIFGEDLPIILRAMGGELIVKREDNRYWLGGTVRKVFEGKIELKNLNLEGRCMQL